DITHQKTRSLKGRNRPSQQITWMLFLAMSNRLRLISTPITCSFFLGPYAARPTTEIQNHVIEMLGEENRETNCQQRSLARQDVTYHLSRLVPTRPFFLPFFHVPSFNSPSFTESIRRLPCAGRTGTSRERWISKAASARLIFERKPRNTTRMRSELRASLFFHAETVWSGFILLSEYNGCFEVLLIRLGA